MPSAFPYFSLRKVYVLLRFSFLSIIKLFLTILPKISLQFAFPGYSLIFQSNLSFYLFFQNINSFQLVYLTDRLSKASLQMMPSSAALFIFIMGNFIYHGN